MLDGSLQARGSLHTPESPLDKEDMDVAALVNRIMMDKVAIQRLIRLQAAC